MSGAMLPTTRADAGSGVRRNGRIAAGWLPVNGTSEPDQGREVADHPVEVPVGVLHRADEVAEQLEADGAEEGAPGQKCAHPHGLVDRGMVAAQDGDGVVA